MRRELILALLALLCLFVPVRGADEPVTPAKSTLPAPADVLAVMKKAADYQLAEQARTPPNNTWIRAAFYTGVMALYDASHDRKYLDAAVRWSQQANWTPLAHGKHPVAFADNLACSQTYCELYRIKPDPHRIDPSRAIFDQQIEHPEPGRVTWWWCDSLFMAPPAYARMSQVTGDLKYDRYLARQWWDATDFLFDKSEGLYYRDKRYFNARTPNGKKVFWARGNGWVIAGLVRVLEVWPDDPAVSADRAKFVDLLRKMSGKLMTLQGGDGLWRTSLLDPKDYPSPETSGSVFFCYAMAWGINHGVLDRATYLPHVIGAWNGLVSCVAPDGRLGYVQKVAGAPGKVDPHDTNEYAVGGFLLAGSEIMKLASGDAAPSASADSRSIPPAHQP